MNPLTVRFTAEPEPFIDGFVLELPVDDGWVVFIALHDDFDVVIEGLAPVVTLEIVSPGWLVTFGPSRLTLPKC